MIEQLLVKVIEISESQATQSAEIKSINRTIHNGMSHRIDETHRTVMLVKEDLEQYKTSGHLAQCPYIADVAEKKQRARKGLLSGWKGIAALVSLGTGVGVLISTWIKVIGG
jgi:hypothetical protein